MSTLQPSDGGDYVPPPQATGRRGRRRKDLSFLPEVPMDVLLEILVLLEPKDLLTMSRASKDFRKALVNETMNRVIWKVKREESGAPAPPPDFSEAKWVGFLFNSFCFGCATPNVITDFFLLKRICVACKKANYLLEDEANPDYAGLLQYVPMTCYAPASSKEPSEERYCWTPDFEQVIYTWNRLWDLIENNDPEARAEVELFKQKRLDLVQWIDRTAPELYGWAGALQEQRQLDKASINERRAETVRLHFYGLGYEQVDVDEVVDSTTLEVCGKPANITNRVWNNIRAKLEPSVIQAWEARLYGLRCELFNIRVQMFAPVWDEWKLSLNLSTADYLTYPSAGDIARLPILSSLMHSEADDVSRDSFLAMVEEFPSIIADFLSSKKADLRDMIPLEHTSADSPDRLELAASVFKPPYNCDRACPQFEWEGVVIGWKQHSMLHGWDTDDEASQYGWSVPVIHLGRFDQELSRVASFLVEACGRDPCTTTTEDMDVLDMRFMCRECMNIALRQRYGLRVDLEGEIPRTRMVVKAYTWRAALSHHRSHFGRDSPRPFKLLDDPTYLEAARDAEADAEPGILAQLPAWFCNHCSGPDGGDSATIGTVSRHLAIEHDRRAPRKGVDYIFNEAYRTKLEEPRSIEVFYERVPVDL